MPKPSPIRYPGPTSKGDHDQDSVTTSKGAFKQHQPVPTKGWQVSVNYKGDQEPIADRTRSQVAFPSSLLPFETLHLPLDEPVAVRMRQILTTPSRSWDLATQNLTHAAYSVLYNETGKLLNYGQLKKHPKYKETWNKYFFNEMGILCQGVNKGEMGLVNELKGKTFV